jgi:hypothetical protein
MADGDGSAKEIDSLRFLKMKRMSGGVPVAVLCGGLAMILALGLLLRSAQARSPQKEAKPARLRWAPPDVDGRIRTISATPPCPLETVIEQAGQRANELRKNLQNFGAQENIEYQDLDRLGLAQITEGTFDYVAVFEQSGGSFSVNESRAPIKASPRFPATVDTGLAALGLIFYPGVRNDYEMSCEGADQWNGQAAWVIHFRQRKDRPSHTLEFQGLTGTFHPGLKGRAWISTDSFQVLHLETNLMEGIPEISLRSSVTEIDYAAVQFHSQNVDLWLPQIAAVFFDYGDRRVMVQHTFSNFHVFLVQTGEVDGKPKEPAPAAAPKPPVP